MVWWDAAPRFYSPVFFLVLAYTHVALPSIPLDVLFRMVLWLSLVAFPFVFTWFCESWFGQRVRRVAPLFAVLYLFYPLQYALRGFGAGGLLRGGLPANWLGVIGILILLGVWRRLMVSPSRRLLSLGVITFATVVMTHIVAGLLAVVIWFPMTIAVRHERQKLLTFIVMAIFAAILSAWWWIPFLSYLPFSASDLIGANIGYKTVAVQMIPLMPLTFCGQVYMLPSLSFFAAWVLVALGVYKHRGTLLAGIFAVGLFVLMAEFFPAVFPTFKMHYYRFIPYFFVIGFVFGVVWLTDFLEKVRSDRARYASRYAIAVAFIGIAVMQWKTAYDGLVRQAVEVPYYTQVPESLHSINYPFMIEELQSLRPRRVLPMLESNLGMHNFGSTHYITANLPGDAETTVITGLYAESAQLTPALMPTIKALSGGTMQSWGEESLSRVPFFTGQPYKYHWERIKHLGVDTVLLSSGEMKGQLNEYLASHSAQVRELMPYTMYQFAEPAPFAQVIAGKPIVFINKSSEFRFNDLMQGLFMHPAAFRVPVVDGGSDLEYWSREKETIAAFVIFAEQLGVGDVPALAELQLPVFLINPSEDLFAAVQGDPLITSINRIVPINEVGLSSEAVQAWVFLGDGLVKLHEEGEAVPVERPDAYTYRFTNTGWSYLRLGYARDWQCESEQPCRVRRVTPGFLAVESDGEVVLRFKRKTVVGPLFAIGAAGVFGLIAFPLVPRSMFTRWDKQRATAA